VLCHGLCDVEAFEVRLAGDHPGVPTHQSNVLCDMSYD
jgi:hypothetical protein